MPESKLVPVIVKKGEPPVWFEVTTSEPQPQAENKGWVLASSDADKKPAPTSLDDALDRIRPLVSVLFEKLSGVAKPPQEIKLDLGVKLSGKVGFFVAESQGEASVAISLKWSA